MQHHKADIFETTRDEVEGYDEFIGSRCVVRAEQTAATAESLSQSGI